MKKLSLLTLVLLTATSFTFAAPAQDEAFTTMNQNDSQALFGKNSVNTIALSTDEMKQTEGENIWVAIGTAVLRILFRPRGDEGRKGSIGNYGLNANGISKIPQIR